MCRSPSLQHHYDLNLKICLLHLKQIFVSFFLLFFYIEQNVYVFDWYGMLAVQLEYLPEIWRFTMWLNWRNRNCWHARWLLWFWLDARWNWQEHRKQRKPIDCSVHTHCIQNFVRCGQYGNVGVYTVYVYFEFPSLFLRTHQFPLNAIWVTTTIKNNKKKLDLYLYTIWFVHPDK